MNTYFTLRRANRLRVKLLNSKSQEQIREVIRYLRRTSWDECGVELIYSDLIDMAVLDHYLVVIDGFTLKFWTREGQYLGTLNSSKVLGDNLNCAKLAPIDGNTLGILAFVRNAQTRLVEIRIFALTFPR